MPARAVERPHERPLEAEAKVLVVRGVLGLRIDPDSPVVAVRVALHQGDYLIERGDPVAPVEALGRSGMGCTARRVRISASVKSEANQPGPVFAPSITAVVLRLANSGWSATSVVLLMFRLVAGDEVPVLGGDEVWLHVVRAQLDGKRIAGERVLGQHTRPHRDGRSPGDCSHHRGTAGEPPRWRAPARQGRRSARGRAWSSGGTWKLLLSGCERRAGIIAHRARSGVKERGRPSPG